MIRSKYLAVKVNGKKYDKHRYLMMQHLGRDLATDEHVHHIDRNPLNNSIDNLMVLSKSDHAKLHRKDFVLSEKVGKP